MAYTHDFEFVVDGAMISGEMAFTHPHPSIPTTEFQPAFHTFSGEEMTVAQHGEFQALLEELGRFTTKFDVGAIHIVKKA